MKARPIESERFLEVGGRSAALGREELQRVLPRRTMIAEEGGATLLRRGLRLEAPGLYLRVFPFDGGRPVVVDLGTASACEDPPQLIELDHVPGDAELRDPGYLRRLAETPPARRHSLVELTDEQSGSNRRFWCRIRTATSTRALLFWALTWKEDVVLEWLGLTNESPLEALQPVFPDAPSDTRARRAEIDRDNREAIVMLATERIEATLPRPAQGARFDAALGLIGAPADVEVEVRIELSEEGRVPRVVEVTVAASGGWSPVAIDPPGDGSSVHVRVESAVVRGDDGDPVVLAIGEPRFTAVTPDRRPDVLLFSLDTVRRDRMQLYGHDVENTPRLVELAARGTVFDDAVSTSSWTLPSHASVFSGQSVQAHGVIDSSRRIGGSALARRFREAGYRTVAFTGGGYLDPTFGFQGGFERYDARDPVLRIAAEDGAYVDVTTHASRRSLELVVADDDPRPLFLFVHTYAAHDYVASDADLARVGADPAERDALPLRIVPPESAARLAAATAAGDRDRFIAATRLVYDATVLAADRLFGDVLSGLGDRRGGGEPYVCAFSDHGEELFEHGLLGHGMSLSEELVRIPLVLAGPGVAAGRRSHTVSLADVGPTLLELAGLPGLAHADGRSLAAVLRGDALAPDPVLLGQRGIDALRGSRYKLVRSGGEDQAHDLLRDPTEDVDLATAEEDLGWLRRALDDALERAARAPAAAEEAVLGSEIEEELGRLGYLGGG